MIKRLFDWTPRDIAYWEKIHHKGMGNFILKYGAITAGLLFILFGLVTLIIRIWQMRGLSTSFPNLVILFGQLLFTALVCLVAGLINSLVTWIVEERLYRKYSRHK